MNGRWSGSVRSEVGGMGPARHRPAAAPPQPAEQIHGGSASTAPSAELPGTEAAAQAGRAAPSGRRLRNSAVPPSGGSGEGRGGGGRDRGRADGRGGGRCACASGAARAVLRAPQPLRPWAALC